MLTSSGLVRHEDVWDFEAARDYDTPGDGMFAPPYSARPRIALRSEPVTAGRLSSPSAAAGSLFRAERGVQYSLSTSRRIISGSPLAGRPGYPAARAVTSGRASSI